MLEKHSVNIDGHSTSFSLEKEFYGELKAIASREKKPLSRIITKIDHERPPEQNLSSALRLYILCDLNLRLKAHQEQS